MLLIAPTPIMAQRLARNLRRRGAAVHVRERQVTVLAGNVATVRAVAQRYAAVEVKP
jgi:ActR/RegA family two-component response regulator